MAFLNWQLEINNSSLFSIVDSEDISPYPFEMVEHNWPPEFLVDAHTLVHFPPN